MRRTKKSGRGTYVLILQLEKATRIRVGKLGVFTFNPGFYAYVGSAFGSGGLGSRLGRHRKVSKPCHWHIDYLRRRCRLIDVLYMVSPVRREHDWAGVLVKTKCASVPVAGFGSSDCGCLSHLVWFGSDPALAVFKNTLKSLFPDDPKIYGIFGNTLISDNLPRHP